MHLSLADDSVVPSHDEIERWIRTIVGAATGAMEVSTIRTSALFPSSAARFREAGFVVADTLELLRAELDDAQVQTSLGSSAGASTPSNVSTVSLRTREFDAAARIDQAAFGRRWGHDAAELDQIRFATPRFQARARVERRGFLRRELVAVAIAGASSEHGYLQRLSVRPDLQGRGHGRALTIDALHWMRRRHLRDCLVNTSVDNGAALALYRSVGFRSMSDRLEVLELDVRDR